MRTFGRILLPVRLKRAETFGDRVCAPPGGHCVRMDVRAARQRHVGRLRASTRVLRAVLFVVGHWWALGK